MGIAALYPLQATISKTPPDQSGGVWIPAKSVWP
jgi:hypothetical protein